MDSTRRPTPDWLFEPKVRWLRHTAIFIACQDPAISRIPHGEFLTRSRLLTAAIISSTDLSSVRRHLFDARGERSRAN
jgi:hypothetical protein